MASSPAAPPTQTTANDYSEPLTTSTIDTPGAETNTTSAMEDAPESAEEPQSQPLAVDATQPVTHDEKSASSPTDAKPALLTRKESEALGPATDNSPSTDASTDSSVLSITLMLTTGARHPYKIDEKYLRSRKVEALDADGQFDPRQMSGYKLKELIWTDWRSEWEPRPASPSSIRLICMGRMLEDKSALKEFPFKLNDINVLHMTVKPADFLDDDETNAGTGKGHHVIRARDNGEGSAGCRCVIL